MLKNNPDFNKDFGRVLYSPIVSPKASDPHLQVLLNNLTEQMNQRLLALHTRIDLLEGVTQDVVFVDSLGATIETLRFERGILQE